MPPLLHRIDPAAIQQPAPGDQPPVLVRQRKQARGADMEALTAADLQEIMAGGANLAASVSKKRWSLAAKIITGLFTLGIAPAIMCRNEGRMERKSAADALRLKAALQRFSDDQEATMQVLQMADKRVTLIKKDDGGLQAMIDRQRIDAKHNAKDMVAIIEDDIVTHKDFYGVDAAKKLFGTSGTINSTDRRDALDRTGADSRHRDLCLKALKANAGIDPSSLHTVNTRYLDRMARYALDGYYGSLSNLLDHVLTITKTNRIAAEDAKELLDAMEKSERERPGELERKVNVTAILPQKPQNATFKQVQGFFADLVYSGNIADEDKFAGKPAERIRQVLEKNAKVLSDLIITESGVKAVKAEQEAAAAEQKASLEGASPAEKAEARALRAEANAAQYEALFFGNYVDRVPDDEDRAVWPAEIRAWKAEAKAIRAEASADPQARLLRADARALRAEARFARAESAEKALGFFLSDAEKAQARADALQMKTELMRARAALAQAQGEDARGRLDALVAGGKPPAGSPEARQAEQLKQEITRFASDAEQASGEADRAAEELRLALIRTDIANNAEAAEQAEKDLESALTGSFGKKAEQARAALSELKAQAAVLRAREKMAQEPSARAALKQAEQELAAQKAAVEKDIGQAQDKLALALEARQGLPADAAEEAVQAAERQVSDARQAFERANARLLALQEPVRAARAALDATSAQSQIDAAKARAGQAASEAAEAARALREANAEIARLEEEVKTNAFANFKLMMAKMGLGKTEARAKEAAAAEAQARKDLAAVTGALAQPLSGQPAALDGRGARFDKEPPHRFARTEDLPQGRQKSLLAFGEAGIDMSMVEEPLSAIRDFLLEEGVPPNETVIRIGLAKEEAKEMIARSAAKLDGQINRMAQGLQDEMSGMILMLDATLKPGMQAGARAIRAALEAQHLPVNAENIDALLEKKPLPAQVEQALSALAGQISGVQGEASKRRLALKMTCSTLKDFVRLDEQARDCERKSQQASAASEAAASAFSLARAEKSHRMVDLQNAGTALADIRSEITQTTQELAAAQAAYAAAKADTEARENEAILQARQALDAARQALEALPDDALPAAAADAERRVAEAQQALDAVIARLPALQEAEREQAKNQVELVYANEKLTRFHSELDMLQVRWNQNKDLLENPTTEASRANARDMTEKMDNLRKAIEQATAEATRFQQAYDAARERGAQLLAQAPDYLRDSAQLRAAETLAQARSNAAAERLAPAVAAHKEADKGVLLAFKDELFAEEDKIATAKRAKLAADAAKKARADADAILQGAPEPGQDAAQAGNANMTAQQKMIADLQGKSLETIAAEAAIDFKSDGYGKFIKIVLLNYFQNASMADKRSMFSAALRYVPENADSNEMLGALLKGAGPILQKVLQGLDGPALPPALRVALKDMKSNLAPIPPEVIRATLLDMVERSNGKIANIEVIKSMGAASVGEALRCRITDSKGQSRECIVKVLRPDAANRAARERAIFENAARQVNGMEGTFKGQYDKIMEELDFTIESNNARMGAVYDNPFNGEKKIQSVKVVEDIPPSTSYMAMELAPGDTLVSFTESARSTLSEIAAQFGASENFNEQGVRTQVMFSANRSQRQQIIEAKKRLIELYKGAKQRYDQMLALTESWVREGIFGEKGFFHGDLHGGNIMSDGNTLTAIDFGNATMLSAEQQSKVITMMIAASTKQTTKFMDALRPLLPDEARQVFDAKYDALREALRVVMQKGTDADTGTRIGAILAVLQKYGVSIPAALFNFSGSELRLQNSVAELGALMQEIQEDLEALDSARSTALENYGDIGAHENRVMTYMGSRSTITKPQVMQAITDGKNAADWALELLGHPGLEYDAGGNFTAGTLPGEFAEGGAKAEGAKLLSGLVSSFSIYAMNPASMGEFYANFVEPHPDAKAAWDANIDNATNKELPAAERKAALEAIMRPFIAASKATLEQFEQEMEDDVSYDDRPQAFFDVVNDVCQANRGAAVWKLGILPAAKFTMFGKL